MAVTYGRCTDRMNLCWFTYPLLSCQHVIGVAGLHSVAISCQWQTSLILTYAGHFLLSDCATPTTVLVKEFVLLYYAHSV